jgi:hypothetical protein
MSFVACNKGDRNDDYYGVGKSVFVSNGDVYVAGIQSYSDGNAAPLANATLWKNGVQQNWGTGMGSTFYSVFVSGGSVYAAGNDFDSSLQRWVAVLWVNGVAKVLVSNCKSYANYP